MNNFFFSQLKWQMSVGDAIGCGCELEAIYLVLHGCRLRLTGELARVWVALWRAAASFHFQCTRDGSSLSSFYAICTECQRRSTSLKLMPLPLIFLLFRSKQIRVGFLQNVRQSIWRPHSVARRRWECGQALRKHFGFILFWFRSCKLHLK